MTVEMPWVEIGVEVVDNDFDNFIVLEHKWIDVAVDDWVARVIGTNTQTGVEGRHICADVCTSIYAKAKELSFSKDRFSFW